MHILSLALIALLGGEQAIDDFRYADTESARRSGGRRGIAVGRSRCRGGPAGIEN